MVFSPLVEEARVPEASRNGALAKLQIIKNVYHIIGLHMDPANYYHPYILSFYLFTCYFEKNIF